MLGDVTPKQIVDACFDVAYFWHLNPLKVKRMSLQTLTQLVEQMNRISTAISEHHNG
jgi:hypothetical protein